MISEKDRAGRLYRDVLAVFTRKQHLDSVQVLLNLFLHARGQPLPQLAKVKSPAALSRFLNHYEWNLRAIIRTMRCYALEQFQLYRSRSRGRSSNVELIVDMTSLPKEGKFPLLDDWMHHFNGVTGVHMVMLYVSCGEVRLPWSFLIWRGKHQTSPAELALKMLARLPHQFRQGRTALHVLADAGFSGRKFIAGVVNLGFTVSVSIQANKVMDTGRAIRQVRRQGQAIFLKDLPQIPLWLYWVWLPTKTGKGKEKRYVVSTIRWTPSTIRKKGRRRWRIEALFKTLKSRFGLHRFGQYTRRGVLRYCCLCLLSFLLCHVQDLEDGESGRRTSPWPDWGELASRVRLHCCGLVRLAELEVESAIIRTVLDSVLRL